MLTEKMNADRFIISPKTLVFGTTYQCTATCKNCCFGCNPKITNRLSLEEMKEYLDQALLYFANSLKVLVLTGGEPFLLKDDLTQIVEYGSSKGLVTRIVSNGFWATSYEEAYEILLNLRKHGLKEINFSTGDEHQKWVSYENIVNSCRASMDLGLTCFVNVEVHDNCEFNGDAFRNDSRLKPYFDATKYKIPLKIERGIWIPFSEDSNISYNNMETKEDLNKKRCESLFTTLPINPYSQLMSCCGLPSERIVPMRLGNLRDNTIKELFELQFQDFLKIWLFVDGPYTVLKYLYEKRGIEKKIIGHLCYVCAEIFKDNENVKYVQEHYEEIMPSVMFKYMMLKPALE